MKSAEEIMNMLEAFDLTGSLRDAGELAGVSHHTVGRYVAAGEAGALSDRPAARVQLIDEHLPKLEEWLERSKGRLRADVAHDKLVALGYTGSQRTTRRAVAAVKRDYRLGRVRVHRPWVTEPGMWLQYDFGDGPLIDGMRTTLFGAWLAWSRFRVVLAIRDKTAPSREGDKQWAPRRVVGARSPRAMRGRAAASRPKRSEPHRCRMELAAPPVVQRPQEPVGRYPGPKCTAVPSAPARTCRLAAVSPRLGRICRDSVSWSAVSGVENGSGSWNVPGPRPGLRRWFAGRAPSAEPASPFTGKNLNAERSMH